MQLNSLFSFLGMNASPEADVDANAGSKQKSSGFGAMLASTLAMLTQKGGQESTGDENLLTQGENPDTAFSEDVQTHVGGFFTTVEDEKPSDGTGILNTGPGPAGEAGVKAESSELSARQKKESESTGIGPLLSPDTGIGVDEQHRHATKNGEGDRADDELLRRSAGSGPFSENDQISEERLAQQRRAQDAAAESEAPPVRLDRASEQAVETPPVDPKILLDSETPSETPESSSGTGKEASSDASLPSDADLNAPEQTTNPANDTNTDKRRGSGPAGDTQPATPVEGDEAEAGNRPLQGSDPVVSTSDTLEDVQADGIHTPPKNDSSDDVLRPKASGSDAPAPDTPRRQSGEVETKRANTAAPSPTEPTLSEADSTTPSKFYEDADGNPVPNKGDGRSTSRSDAAGDVTQRSADTNPERRNVEQGERIRVVELERASHRRPAERINVWTEPSNPASSDAKVAETSSTAHDADDLKPSVPTGSAIDSKATAGDSAAANATKTDVKSAATPKPPVGIDSSESTEPRAGTATDSEAAAATDSKPAAAIDSKAAAAIDSKPAAQSDAAPTAKKGAESGRAAGTATDVRTAPAESLTDTAKASATTGTKQAGHAAADAQKSADASASKTPDLAAVPAGLADETADHETRADQDRVNSLAKSGDKADSGNAAKGDGGAQNDFMKGSDTQPDDAFVVAADELSPDAVDFDVALQDESVTVDVPVDVQNPESTERMTFTPERAQNTATTSSNPLAEVARAARPRQAGSLNWMRAMLDDSLKGLSLEDDWKVLEMKLDEGQGTMTVRARRDDDKISISVNFTDPQLRALATEQAQRLQETLSAQYATQVDFSLMNDNAGQSQQRRNQEPRDDSRGVDNVSRGHGHSLSGADLARVTRAALVGARNEWVG